jgi:multidrug efflux pump subunit AcrA (membrane-fusion protein)
MSTTEVDLRLADSLSAAVGASDLQIESTAPMVSHKWGLTFGLLALVGAVGAGAAIGIQSLGDGEQNKWLTEKVTKGDLVVTVTAKGTLESASNENIKCRVAGGSKIVEIVENGKYVRAGDHLVTLDTSLLEDQIQLQSINVNRAMALKDLAEKEYEVAQIAVTEYEQGTFVQLLQTAQAAVTIAQENLSSAKNSLEHSQRMHRKGYISDLQLDAQVFAVKRTTLELGSAETAVTVLRDFTKTRMVTELKSKVVTAKSKMESERNAFTLEENRLKRLTNQLKNCVIKAPKDGVVVHANESDRRSSSQSTVIEQGATIAEGKDILRLPDMSKMQTKLLVNETKVGRLQVDMPAVVRIQGDRYQGRITAIANQHEHRSWSAAEVREYPVIVMLEKLVSEGSPAEFSLTGANGKSVDARQFDKNSDGTIKRQEIPSDDKDLLESFDQVDINRDDQLDPRDQLKPGMTADAVITVETLEDVLKIPVTSVVSKGADRFCWIVKGGEVERRSVKPGRTDDSHYQVLSGVAEGDEVVMDPRTSIEEARRLEQEAKVEEAAQRAAAADALPPESPANLPPGVKAPPGGPKVTPVPGAAKTPGAKPRTDWKDYDKDGDGKTSRDEVPEDRRDFFDRVDANGDGFIDALERSQPRKRPATGPGTEGGGGVDARPTP